MQNWYTIAKNINQIEKEAGILSDALRMAIVAVMGGASIWWASQHFGVSESSIQSHMTNQDDAQTTEQPQNTNDTTTTAVVNEQLINNIRNLEGTIAYQKHVGHYRNEHFYPYKDSRGFLTVGYGHRVLPKEDFSNGITNTQAETLLRRDAAAAVEATNGLLSNTPVTQGAAQVIANMVYQLGPTGVRGFGDMWIALQQQDYETAAEEMLDSLWARNQTTQRATDLANIMRNQ